MKLVIFDWKRTLFHPQSMELADGAKELFQYLESKDIRMVIFGKDQGGDMQSMVDKFDIRHFFHEIKFITDQKSAEMFRDLAKDFDIDQVWVVGDRIKGEINKGNEIGAQTVWLKNGKFAGEAPESDEEKPNYTFSSLHELLGMFTKNDQQQAGSEQ